MFLALLYYVCKHLLMTFHELAALTDDEARRYFINMRWSEGVKCPHCGDNNCKELAGKSHRSGLFKCYGCRKQFSATVGTVFHSSHIGIKKWLLALHLMVASKKGISACQLQRALDLKSYKSAWFMCHRLRHAMAEEPMAGMLSGKIEADETYIGGKPKKRRDGQKNPHGRGTEKACVLVIVQRGGKAISKPITWLSAKSLVGSIKEIATQDSAIYTDEFPSYRPAARYFTGGHHVVKHSKGEYARGEAHSNTCESYFSLMKRGITGAFHHVSKHHLHRYCAEFDFRWNTRQITDSERCEIAMKRTVGKRLTYKEPTSNVA